MSRLGALHTAFAVAALVIGATVVMRRKGTRSHRWLGRAYVTSMVGVIVTSFLIYRLFGSFGVFHWAAVVSSLTLIAGLTPVLLRRPKGKWLHWHLSFMAYSYLGLLAAAASEVAVRSPVVPLIARTFGIDPWHAFGLAVGIPTTVIFTVGPLLIKTKGFATARHIASR